MTIEDRNLKAGMVLVARYKGDSYRCEVEDTPEGIRYKLLQDEGTTTHKSPSAAGSAIMGGNACNGWRFWSLEGSEEVKPKAKETQGEGFRRIPGGRAWCNGCAAAFKVETGTTPTVCPKGHTPEGVVAEIEREAVAVEA